MSDSEVGGTDGYVDSVAIIAMNGRFPGARNVDQFWDNLRQGIESISFFSTEELRKSGINPAVIGRQEYVNAKGILDGIELFDASFFGFNPREAEIMDPQHRIFLECAWETFEAAGYDPKTYKGPIGVYAGVSRNTYLLANVYANPAILELTGHFQAMLGNDKDFVPTRVSYKLNLRGPSMAVQTACSTALVAVSLAAQSLLNYQCDMALAGGISIKVPQIAGYTYQEGGIGSPDGHCRAFDARAQGTVSGSGAGLVLLKRLADARADGDNILAIIRGWALNNDGYAKVGYTAPSVDGQAEVIAAAQALAGVSAETISYIETHGTGTPLGDPIEVAALTRAFRASTDKRQFCAIGSVKTNVGHLDTAAGIAALIKTVQALRHKELPPSLNFEQPNPQIDFASSPFYVNSRLAPWPRGSTPRRAGVSSFGIGGTNAHMILEEAPPVSSTSSLRPQQLLLLSAKTASALETATGNLANHLKHSSELNLADVAYTLGIGRSAFSHRRAVVCSDLQDAVQALESPEVGRIRTSEHEASNRPVVFMFPGQGAQYVNMAAGLYEVEASFRKDVDLCAELLGPQIGLDLRDVLYPSSANQGAASDLLNQTFITQPALFTIEYALARLWMRWGVAPTAMIGHSIGEYVAACLAGVFSLEDALALVAERGRLMQSLPAGSMLAVMLPAPEVQRYLHGGLAMAALNAESVCVVSGATQEISALETELGKLGIGCRLLKTSHAFHSSMLDPILVKFTECARTVEFRPPQIPYISNVSGEWITPEQATSPDYWALQMRQTVRFADGLQILLQQPQSIFLEVGPGNTLGMLTSIHPARTPDKPVISSLSPAKNQHADWDIILNSLGELWLAGLPVDWRGFYAGESRRRVVLPTYPFERQRYWIDPQTSPLAANMLPKTSAKTPHPVDWLYVPIWKQSLAPILRKEEPTPGDGWWLILSEDCRLAQQVSRLLEKTGRRVVTARAGQEFARLDEHEYSINVQSRDDYIQLLKQLDIQGQTPARIVHFLSISPNNRAGEGVAFFEQCLDSCYYSLLLLAQAIGECGLSQPLQIDVVTNQTQKVTGEELFCPEKTVVLGPCKVIPREYPNILCRSIDITLPVAESRQEDRLTDMLTAELLAAPADLQIAFRANSRWVQKFEKVPADRQLTNDSRLRQGGVYLITGGLGRIGLLMASYIAKAVQGQLILTGRSAFPDRSEWASWLASHSERDSTSRKIRAVQEIEALGSIVLIVQADSADEEAMRKAISQAEAHFGAINGVFHAAGITSDEAFRAIQLTGEAITATHMRPKVYGLFVLEKLLRGYDLDFCILFSSLSSVIGGPGHVAYSAVNNLMDAFARKQNQAGDPIWMSINWDGWRFSDGDEKNPTRTTAITKLFMTPVEGVESLQRALSLREVAQLVVSTGDLEARIDETLKRRAFRQQAAAASLDRKENHPRPSLSTNYLAPADDVERKVVELWQSFLGIRAIGMTDNFFELGGHSLLATRLISKLRESFQVDLPLRDFFDAATPLDVSEAIKRRKNAPVSAQLLPITRQPRRRHESQA
jgi:acyl transferase domain-containing protein/acyl carrier protein